MRLTLQKLNELIEASGLETHESYSGRNMFGKVCPAVVAGSSFQAIAEIVEQCDDCKVAADIVRYAMTDSLGGDTVVYWPRFGQDRDKARRQA